ncbi:MAG: serine/threonine protein kinase [Xanthomonadales bacterium]|nr:serine/threonine protein kinase [Xanthomonadales bacterium]
MPDIDPLADAATEFQAASPPSEADHMEAGARLGDYIIVRLLGEGGMGRVYLAEQTRPVRREVALKLLREQVASPLALAYFDVERQALAQMHHPAIAQVFDAGTTPGGHPFLAMEVVEGQPVTHFCREAGLSLDQRLALFARICRGVQHAHQKGIIHRDLKPANVLVRDVDGEAVPKIIDFGIAIGDAEGSGAEAPDAAGTAVYMSPEQAGHGGRRLDTRSDVYSLGVMLFEVLTDATAAAFDTSARRSGAAPRTLVQEIDRAEARGGGASELVRAAVRLPAGLRAVLRKALATEREDRYDSAAALAEDLERFRERRPLQAVPHSRAYVLRTLAARHRFGLATAAAMLLALVAGAALALHGMTLARHSEAIARQEATRAAQVSEFVRGMLAGVDPEHARGMDTRLMRSILDAAATRASHELAAQPDVHADIETMIGDSYASLGEFALADSHYQAALAATREAGEPPIAVAEILSRRAATTGAAGDSDQALQEARRAVTMAGDLPSGDRRRLRLEHGLAALEREAGLLEASRTRFGDVLARQRASLGADDADTLATMQGLAITNLADGHYDEAEGLLKAVIAQFRRQLGPDDIKTLGAIVTLGVLLNEREHYAEATALLAPVLPAVERLYGPDHPRTLVVVMNLGSALRYGGRYEEARPYYLRALELSRKLYGPTAQRTLMAEGNLSLMLRDAGALGEAERHARFVADHADDAFGDNPYRGSMFRGLASILIREGRYAEAERQLDRAWAAFTSGVSYGPDHPRAQEVVDSFIELYTAWKKPTQAAEWQARKSAPPMREPAVAAASRRDAR